MPNDEFVKALRAREALYGRPDGPTTPTTGVVPASRRSAAGLSDDDLNAKLDEILGLGEPVATSGWSGFFGWGDAPRRIAAQDGVPASRPPEPVADVAPQPPLAGNGPLTAPEPPQPPLPADSALDVTDRSGGLMGRLGGVASRFISGHLRSGMTPMQQRVAASSAEIAAREEIATSEAAREITTRRPRTPMEDLAYQSAIAKVHARRGGDPRTEPPAVSYREPIDTLGTLNKHRAAAGLKPVAEMPGPAGFGDVMGRQWATGKGLIDKIPGVGAGVDAYSIWGAVHAAERVEDGTATEADWGLLADFQDELVEQMRGTKFWGGAADILSESMPFMAEFMVSGGLAPLIKGGAKKGARKLAGGKVSRLVSGGLRRIAEAGGKTAPGRVALGAGRLAVDSAARMPAFIPRIAADTARRMLPDYVLTPGDGRAIEMEVRDPGLDFWPALRDGIGDTYIEVLSEGTGGGIGKLGNAVGRRLIRIPEELLPSVTARFKTGVMGRMMARFPHRFRNFEQATQFLRSAGYHGVLNEMGEEEVGWLLRQAVMEALGDRTTIDPGEHPGVRELAQQFVAFSVPAVGAEIYSAARGDYRRGGGPPEPELSLTPPPVAPQQAPSLDEALRGAPLPGLPTAGQVMDREFEAAYRAYEEFKKEDRPAWERTAATEYAVREPGQGRFEVFDQTSGEVVKETTSRRVAEILAAEMTTLAKGEALPQQAAPRLRTADEIDPLLAWGRKADPESHFRSIHGTKRLSNFRQNLTKIGVMTDGGGKADVYYTPKLQKAIRLKNMGSGLTEVHYVQGDALAKVFRRGGPAEDRAWATIERFEGAIGSEEIIESQTDRPELPEAPKRKPVGAATVYGFDEGRATAEPPPDEVVRRAKKERPTTPKVWASWADDKLWDQPAEAPEGQVYRLTWMDRDGGARHLDTHRRVDAIESAQVMAAMDDYQPDSVDIKLAEVAQEPPNTNPEQISTKLVIDAPPPIANRDDEGGTRGRETEDAGAAGTATGGSAGAVQPAEAADVRPDDAVSPGDAGVDRGPAAGLGTPGDQAAGAGERGSAEAAPGLKVGLPDGVTVEAYKGGSRAKFTGEPTAELRTAMMEPLLGPVTPPQGLVETPAGEPTMEKTSEGGPGRADDQPDSDSDVNTPPAAMDTTPVPDRPMADYLGFDRQWMREYRAISAGNVAQRLAAKGFYLSEEPSSLIDETFHDLAGRRGWSIEYEEVIPTVYGRGSSRLGEARAWEVRDKETGHRHAVFTIEHSSEDSVLTNVYVMEESMNIPANASPEKLLARLSDVGRLFEAAPAAAAADSVSRRKLLKEHEQGKPTSDERDVGYWASINTHPKLHMDAWALSGGKDLLPQGTMETRRAGLFEYGQMMRAAIRNPEAYWEGFRAAASEIRKTAKKKGRASGGNEELNAWFDGVGPKPAWLSATPAVSPADMMFDDNPATAEARSDFRGITEGSLFDRGWSLVGQLDERAWDVASSPPRVWVDSALGGLFFARKLSDGSTSIHSIADASIVNWLDPSPYSHPAAQASNERLAKVRERFEGDTDAKRSEEDPEPTDQGGGEAVSGPVAIPREPEALAGEPTKPAAKGPADAPDAGPQAAKLRAMADGMEAAIGRALKPPAMTKKPRTRESIEKTRGKETDGRRLIRLRDTMRILADMWDAGQVPEVLRHLTSRAAIEEVLWTDNPDVKVPVADIERTLSEASGRPGKRSRASMTNKTEAARKLGVFSLDVTPELFDALDRLVKQAKGLPGTEVLNKVLRRHQHRVRANIADPEVFSEAHERLKSLLTDKKLSALSKEYDRRVPKPGKTSEGGIVNVEGDTDAKRSEEDPEPTDQGGGEAVPGPEDGGAGRPVRPEADAGERSDADAEEGDPEEADADAAKKAWRKSLTYHETWTDPKYGGEVELWALDEATGKKHLKKVTEAAFPVVPKAVAIPVALSGKAVTDQNIIGTVARAAAEEPSRYSTDAVMIEDDAVVAIDGWRMHIVWGDFKKWNREDSRVKGNTGVLYLVSGGRTKKTLKMLTERGDKGGGGRFPDWRGKIQVLPRLPHLEFKNDAAEVIRMSERAHILDPEDSRSIILVGNPDGTLGMVAHNPEVGQFEQGVKPGGRMIGASTHGILQDAMRLFLENGHITATFTPYITEDGVFQNLRIDGGGRSPNWPADRLSTSATVFLAGYRVQPGDKLAVFEEAEARRGGGSGSGPAVGQPANYLPTVARGGQMFPSKTREEAEWLRKRLESGDPAFGLGGALALGGQARNVWQATIDRITKALHALDPKTHLGKAMRYTGRLLYGAKWGLPEDIQDAFSKIKGAKKWSNEEAALLTKAIDKRTREIERRDRNTAKRLNLEERTTLLDHVDDLRAEMGEAALSDEGGVQALILLTSDDWRDENAKELAASVAKAMNELGVRNPEAQKALAGPKADAILDEINELRELVEEVPLNRTEGRDLLMVLTARVMPDIVERHKMEYWAALEDAIRTGNHDDLGETDLAIVGEFMRLVDGQRDELIERTDLHPYMVAFGLENIIQIMQQAKDKGRSYLRRLYELATSDTYKPEPLDSWRNVGPRLLGGPLKGRRSEDQLWTVIRANGMSRQFDNHEDAAAFHGAEIEANLERYGESVYARVRILEPFGEDVTESLKPIKDVRELMVKTLVTTSMNLQTLKLFQELAATVGVPPVTFARTRGKEIPELEQGEYVVQVAVSSGQSVTWTGTGFDTKDEAVRFYAGKLIELRRTKGEDATENIRMFTRNPEHVETVPAAEDAGDLVPLMRSASLGPLSGMYVPEAVAHNIMLMEKVRRGTVNMIYDLWLSIWKFTKVPLSWETWGRNMTGLAVYFWPMAGLNPLTDVGHIRRALVGWRDRDADYLYLLENNVLRTGYVGELSAQILDSMTRDPSKRFFTAMAEVLKTVGKAGSKIGDAYDFPDQISKLVAFKKYRANGMPKVDARRRVNNNFPNYEEIGNLAKWARRSPVGAPFVAFTDQAAKSIAYNLRDRPIRLFALYSMPAVMTAMTRMLLGIDDEEMELINSARDRQSWPDRLYQPLVPVRDKDGRVLSWDWRFIMPLADDFKVATGPGGIGIPYLLSQPLVNALTEAMMNRDEYTGRNISTSDQTDLEKIDAHVTHFLKAVGPIPPFLLHRLPSLIRKATDENTSPGEFNLEVVRALTGMKFKPPYISQANVKRILRGKLDADDIDGVMRVLRLYEERYKKPDAPPLPVNRVIRRWAQAEAANAP